MPKFWCHQCDAEFVACPPIATTESHETQSNQPQSIQPCPQCRGEFTEAIETIDVSGSEPQQPQQEHGNQENQLSSRPTLTPMNIVSEFLDRFIGPFVGGGEFQIHTFDSRNGFQTFGSFEDTSAAFGSFQLPNNINQWMEMMGMPGNMGDCELIDVHVDQMEYLDVMNGRSFDDIISSLMEQSAGRNAPPPASDEILRQLPRTIIEQNELLGEECAICIDKFKAGDCCIHLPCRHHFHELCSINWLKINGTCPVCRMALNGGSSDVSETTSSS